MVGLAQPTGRDHPGVVQGEDLPAGVVEPVELKLGGHPLLAAEDPLAQLHRGGQLGRGPGGPDRDGEPAVRAQGGGQAPDFARIAWNASMNSIGTGKTIVVFWLTPISSSVCR